MGRVFYAIDTTLDRPVAIKVIHPHLANNPKIIERFRQEAKSAARLNHNGIVHVYEFGQNEKGTPYFVMEYVEGVSLKQFLRRRGSFHVREALRVTLSLVKALEYAHKQNVIHRDIKPANVLVTRDGSIKILDFGLARILTSDSDDRSIIGSPHYMSPEQGKGEDNDHRSDIYSLGITLYHMLMGTVPYISKDPLEIIKMHINDPIPEPDSLKSISNGRLMEMLKKMLAKQPEERFQNYSELRKSIQKLLHGHISQKASAADKTKQNQAFELNTTEYRPGQTQQVRMAKNLYFDDDLNDEPQNTVNKAESVAQEPSMHFPENPDQADVSENTVDWQIDVDSDIELATDQAPGGDNSGSWVYTTIMILLIILAGAGAVGYLSFFANNETTPSDNQSPVALKTATPAPTPTATPTPAPTPEIPIPVQTDPLWIQSQATIMNNISAMINGIDQAKAEKITQDLMTFDAQGAMDSLNEIALQIGEIAHDEARDHHIEKINVLRDIVQLLKSEMEYSITRFKHTENPLVIDDPLTTATLQIPEVVDSGIVLLKQGQMEPVFWNDLHPVVVLSIITAAYAPEPTEPKREQIQILCEFYGIDQQNILSHIQHPELMPEAYLPAKTPEPALSPDELAIEEHNIPKKLQPEYLTIVNNIRNGYGGLQDDIAYQLAARLLFIEFKEASELIRKELIAKSSKARTEQERAYMSTLVAIKQYLEKLIGRKHQIIIHLKDLNKPLVLPPGEDRKAILISRAGTDKLTINNKERPWRILRVKGFTELAKICFPEELDAPSTVIKHPLQTKRPNEIQMLEALITPHPNGNFYLIPE